MGRRQNLRSPGTVSKNINGIPNLRSDKYQIFRREFHDRNRPYNLYGSFPRELNISL